MRSRNRVDSESLAAAGRHWDVVQSAALPTRFWQVPACLRAINANFGVGSDEWGAGLTAVLRKRLSGRVLKKAISIGCGPGSKELALLKARMVEHFDLFEISATRIAHGQRIYQAAGMAASGTFHSSDGLQKLATERTYDLVFWDNSLHHMADTRAVLEMSVRALTSNGVLYVNEFVGPDRFQWSDAELLWANRVRGLLPARFFDISAGARYTAARRVTRPSIESMLAVDPTEAIDSSAILPALRSLAAVGDTWLLGGVIYHLSLNDLLANFRSPEDDALLQSLLLLDGALSAGGLNHYAAALVTAPQ